MMMIRNRVGQFRYGEDGLDVGKAMYMENQLQFLVANHASLQECPMSIVQDANVVRAKKLFEKVDLSFENRVKGIALFRS